MTKTGRRIRLILVILLCVILIGLVVGWFFVAPKVIESKANEALVSVSEKTGRQVAISGIHLSGLRQAVVDQMTLSDVGQPEKTGVLLNHVEISLSSLPMGDFSISSIEADELNVTVRVSEGKTNFDDLLEALRPKAGAVEGGEKKPKAWKRYITPFPAIHVASLAVTMPSVHVNQQLEVGALSGADLSVQQDENGIYEVGGDISALLVESQVPTTYESRLVGHIRSGKEGEISLSMPKSQSGQTPELFNQESRKVAFESLRMVLPTTFEVHGFEITEGEKSLVYAQSARARLMTLPPKKVSGVYLKEVELDHAQIHDYWRKDGSALLHWASDFVGELTSAWRDDVKKKVEEKAAQAAVAAVAAGIDAVANDEPNPGNAMIEAAANELAPKKKPKDYFFSQRMFLTDCSITVEDQRTGMGSLEIGNINAEVGYRSIRKVLDYRVSLASKQPLTSEIELFGQYDLPKDKAMGELIIHPLRAGDGFKKVQAGIQEENAAHPEKTSIYERLLPSIQLDNTELETSLKFAYDLKKEILDLSGKLSVKDFVFQLESLSKEPAHINGSLGIDVQADLGQKDFQIKGMDIETNGAKLGVKAHLSKQVRQVKPRSGDAHGQTVDAWHFDVSADLPDQEMQGLFDAIPHALRSELDGLTWTGTLGFHFEASGFLDALSETQHKFSVVPSANFSVIKWPANRNINALNHGFKYTIQDPNALSVHDISIPPSIYPIYAQENPIYLPRMQAEEMHLSYPDWVLFDDLNPWLIQLITTTEDGSFFTHQGFSPLQVKAALERNVNRQSFSRGASTISMQLVKNLFFDRSKTISRKFQEVIYTWLMESVLRIPKKRIMELYFNIIEFGPEIYGVEEAAKYYFGKRSQALSLKESAFLMAIIPNPRKGAVYRTQPVLDKWIQKTMQFYIQEMYRRKCDQDVLARTRERLAKQGKPMVYEPCCPPKDSLQLMLESDTLSFYLPDPDDPTKYAYRPDLYTPDGTSLNPVRTTSCGYRGELEGGLDTLDGAESIFEAFVPAADINEAFDR